MNSIEIKSFLYLTLKVLVMVYQIHVLHVSFKK